MISIQNITTTSRQKNKPNQVSASSWANAVNWNIEAWKCYLSGQKWAHSFEICCPEQYYMLLNKKGQFILDNLELVSFTNSVANQEWVNRLSIQIADMRAKGEWTEAIVWSRLLNKVTMNLVPTPNEDAFKKSKKVVKGYRLIRIKTAA